MVVIVAIANFLVAMVPALVLRPAFGDRDVVLRVGIYVLIATILAFLIPYPLAPVFFLALGCLAAFMSGKQPLAIFFAAFLYALPATLNWNIPFPGVNYLVNLNPLFVLSVALLPTLLRDKFSWSSGGTTACVVLFVLLSWVLNLREYTQSPTNALRELIVAVVTIIVPYLVIRKSLSDPRRLTLAVTAFAVCIFFVTLVAWWSAIRGWLFYLHMPLNYFDYKIFGTLSRGGSMRFLAATNFVETPLLIAMAGMASLWLRATWPKGILNYAWLALVPVAVVAAGGRGGLLAALIAFAAYIFLRYFPKGLRMVGYVGAIIAAIIAFPIVLTADFSFIDPYGTFKYRQDLLSTALTRLSQTFWFGDANYETHPIFDANRQGQGIVDFVNAYVQVGLANGVIGLGLLLGMMVLPFRLALKTAYGADPGLFGDQVNARNLGFGIAAAIVANAVMIMTVSEISHIGYFKYLIAAFAVAYHGAVRKAQDEAST
ncbi:MAG: O-antigen ligase family protein [Pseudomonadota bacterium]